MRERKAKRALYIAKGEHVASEKRITFETPAAMLTFLTPQRLRLCEAAREKPRSVTELAITLQRDRKSVHRDIQAMQMIGMLRLERKTNPGHGQVQMVAATASRFHLSATV